MFDPFDGSSPGLIQRKASSTRILNIVSRFHGVGDGPARTRRLSRLRPFELKNILIERAAGHGERLMLNAGHGNPNFLAIEARKTFFELGLLALQEAKRADFRLAPGVAGLPAAKHRGPVDAATGADGSLRAWPSGR